MNTPVGQSAEPKRLDPIGDHYYVPLSVSDRVERLLFYLSAAASFAPLTIDERTHHRLHELSLSVFVVTVVLSFGITVANRLYFFPRAQDARRRGLASDAFAVLLSQPLPVGYYSNTFPPSPLRLGACTLESVFFTKSILAKMARWERLRAIAYFTLWILATTFRDTDIDLLAAGAQLVLSEQILSRWMRLEWSRARMERLYDAAYQFFTTGANLADAQNPKAQAYMASLYADYEAAKMLGGIVVSKQIFDRERAALDVAWTEIEQSLHARPQSTGNADDHKKA
jgi:hypothetical protein